MSSPITQVSRDEPHQNLITQVARDGSQSPRPQEHRASRNGGRKKGWMRSLFQCCLPETDDEEHRMTKVGASSNTSPHVHFYPSARLSSSHLSSLASSPVSFICFIHHSHGDAMTFSICLYTFLPLHVMLGHRLQLSRDYLLPPLLAEDSGKKTLVLDLDETLVHSSFKVPFCPILFRLAPILHSRVRGFNLAHFCSAFYTSPFSQSTMPTSSFPSRWRIRCIRSTS